MEGSIVNQVEISGFADEKEAVRFRKKLKSFKSAFSLPSFKADEASWKIKENHSLVYLFLTEDSFPEEAIGSLAAENENLEIQHLLISPSGCGEMMHFHYRGKEVEKSEFSGEAVLMLGDLIKGGFQ